MEGRLFVYNEREHLSAFESGKVESCDLVVMLGGLTDGLLACPYVERLGEILEEKGKVALVQPMLRSSLNQFGFGSLEKDVEDLESLFTFYENQGRILRSISIIGHSTGCQIAVLFAKRASEARKALLRSIILQGPVSDREALPMEMSKDTLNSILERARACVHERPMEIVHQLWERAPVTARRFLDLFDKNGADDFFSSDLSDGALRERLGHLDDFKVLIAFSEDDEYIPHDVYPQFCKRLQMEIPKSTMIFLENANHDLSKPNGASEQFLAAVLAILPDFGPNHSKTAEAEEKN